MKKQLDFKIDKLTRSIENAVTGDRFQTEVSLLSAKEAKDISKKTGWVFNWKQELKFPEREVYKLTILNNQTVIQALISLEVKTDHVFMHLLESADFNKGRQKVYAGVAGNLVAFACKVSAQRGFEGNVAFLSKSKLVGHYEKTLGARLFKDNLMFIETTAARKLLNQYFPTTEL